MFARALLSALSLLFSATADAAPPSVCERLFTRIFVLADGARIQASQILRNGDTVLDYNPATHQLRWIQLDKNKSGVIQIDFEFDQWSFVKNKVLLRAKLVEPYEQEAFYLYDLKTGDYEEFLAAKGTRVSDSVVDQSLETSGHVVANDIRNTRPDADVFKSDGKEFALVEGNGLRVFAVGTEESRRIELPGTVARVMEIPGLWKRLVTFQNHPPVVVDLATGEIRAAVAALDGSVPNFLRLTSDGKHALFQRTSSGELTNYLVIDLATMEAKNISARAPKAMSISPDGAWVADLNGVADPQKQFRLLSTGGAAPKEITENGRIDFTSLQYSRDGKQLFYSVTPDAAPEGMQTPRKFVVLNIASGERNELSHDFAKMGTARFHSMAEDGKTVYFQTMGDSYTEVDKSFYLHRWRIGTDRIESMKIPGAEGRVNLLIEKDGASAVVIQPGQSKPVTRVDLHTWTDVAKAGVAPIPADEASLIEALRPVLRPDKYKTGLHNPLIVEFFEKAYYRSKPELILPSLYALLSDSPGFYREMLEKYPDILSLMKAPVPGWKEIPAKARKAWVEAAQDHIQTRIHLQGAAGATLDEWKDLRPLEPLFKEMDEDAKSEFARMVASSLTAHAGANAQGGLQGVYDQKLFKFTKAAMKKFFGIEDVALTDLTYTRTTEGSAYSGGSRTTAITPKIIATEPIEGGTLTPYGIYVKDLPQVPVAARAPGSTAAEELGTHTVSWKAGEHSYTAEIKLSRPERRSGEIAPSTLAPDYASNWKDNKLTGVVMPDQREGADLLDEYMNYYLDKGFEFVEDVKVRDSKEWLAKEISSGHMDYFVKEAHSDGSDQYLFRFWKAGTFKKGVKQLENGRTEEIYLFYPEPNSGGTQIDVPEFGQWMRRREATAPTPAEAPQFTYFNTSCSSMYKACAEIGAAASPRFLNISTSTMANTMQNLEESAPYQLLESFRGGKNFEEMRAALGRTSEYPTYDRYMFPDSPDFDTNIRQKIGDPVEIRINIKDSDGKSYDFDTVG